QWSFEWGMGENLYPFSIDIVATPLLYFFFRQDVASGMLWIQLIYTFLSGIAFFLFLRSEKFNDTTTIIGALAYSCSSFMLGCGSWVLIVFPAVVFLFALLFLSLSLFFKHQQLLLYPIVIALIAIQQPFNIYFAALITIIYWFFVTTIPTYFEWGKLKSYYSLWQLAVAGCIGLGLSAFLLLSNLYQMLNSPRGSGEYNYSYIPVKKWYEIADTAELKTNFLRLFATNLEGSAIQYAGHYNYLEAPFLYCGLFVLLLVPQLFVFLPKRAKILYAFVLLLALASLVFPSVRYAFWLFSGNYYRILGLFITILLLLYSLKALNYIIEGRKLNIALLFSSVGVYSLFLLYNRSSVAVIAPSITLLFLLLLALSILLYFADKMPNFSTILLALVCLELFIINNPILSERITCTQEEIYSHKGYNDKTLQVVDYLRKKDKSFWRLEKDYASGVATHASLNDALIQNYYGIRTYNSFNNVNFIRFMATVGELNPTEEFATRWVFPPSSPFVLRLCGIKYFLSKSTNDLLPLQEQTAYKIEDFEPIKILALNYPIPFGVTFDQQITRKKFEKLPAIIKQKTLLQAIVVEDDSKAITNSITPFSPMMTDTSMVVMNSSLAAWVNKLKEDTLQLTQYKPNQLLGKIDLRREKMLFLPIPYHKGWTLRIDDKVTNIEKAFGGLMGVLLPAGSHTVVLSFTDPYKDMGVFISLLFVVILLLWFRRAYKQ
ncbi:MAG: YfhO family protein, partial [Thermoflexibacteraceae bacterium]